MAEKSSPLHTPKRRLNAAELESTGSKPAARRHRVLESSETRELLWTGWRDKSPSQSRFMDEALAVDEDALNSQEDRENIDPKINRSAVGVLKNDGHSQRTAQAPAPRGGLLAQRMGQADDARTLLGDSRGGGEAAKAPLVSRCLLPEHAACFKFAAFNAMQASCWEELYLGSGNMVVSAPTGAGKTVLFELAILGMLRNQLSSPKALYLAPLKALCQEKAREWSEQFGQIGIVVVELTGDQEGSVGRRSSRLAKASIIVSTPDMWDYFMRQAIRGSSAMSVVEALQLVCVDEVHMLGMPKRGAILESVVARLRTLRQLSFQEKPLRLVAVSATVPNIADIGAWLSVAPANIKAFGMEHRPVPLRVHVQTFRGGKNEFMFQESLNRELGPVIQRYSEGKATLVFCVTKRACETAASSLRDSRSWQPVPSVRAWLVEKAAEVSDATLRGLLPHGLAFHHSGLSASDRRLVETLFLETAVQVLFCTQTLALGVNLPARLVVVKGTTAYKEGGWEEYDELEMLQIMGRAGRPQFDDQGVAVILAEEGLSARWQQMLEGQPLESNLPERLTEALLCEVVAGSIQNQEALCTWLAGTFLAVRARRDPRRYAAACPLLHCQAPHGHPLAYPQGPDVTSFLQLLSQAEEAKMGSAGLISKSAQHPGFQATPLGGTLCRCGVRVSTLHQLQAAGAPQDMKELLWLLASTSDFEEFRPRQGERTQLRSFAKGRLVRWPFTGPIDTAAKKVLVLLMLGLADSPRQELSWELKAQQGQAFRRCEPLLQVASEFFEAQKQGPAVAACLLLRKCLQKQIWEDTTMPVRQLKGIGDKLAVVLHQQGFASFQGFASADPRLIAQACQSRVSGPDLQAKLLGIPRIGMRLTPDGSSGTIHIQLASSATGLMGQRSGSLGAWSHLVVYSAPEGQLLKHLRFPSCQPPEGLSIQLQSASGLAVLLINEDVVGLDERQSLGDSRLAPRPSSDSTLPTSKGYATRATSGQGNSASATPRRAPKRKAAPQSGHEATFALALAKSTGQVETLTSPAAQRNLQPMPPAMTAPASFPSPMHAAGSNQHFGFAGEPDAAGAAGVPNASLPASAFTAAGRLRKGIVWQGPLAEAQPGSSGAYGCFVGRPPISMDMLAFRGV